MQIDPAQLAELLRAVEAGERTARETLDALAETAEASRVRAGGEDVDAQVELDFERLDRCGFPEVVYGPGKSLEVLVHVVQSLRDRRQAVLATRLDATQTAELSARFPEAHVDPIARTFRWDAPSGERIDRQGSVAVVTAGTGDLPVAREACQTLAWMQVDSQLIADVGVAGPHRLRKRASELRAHDAVVVVAGMEGALPSVVAGYVDRPVIGVPTSVGYGASLGGWSALLSMLNSCAANVCVVNIDAGFKAGYVAGMIARTTAQRRATSPPSAMQVGLDRRPDDRAREVESR